MSARFTAAEALDLARLFQDLARSPGLRGMEDQVSLVLSRDDLTRLAALLVGESESVSNARAEALREAVEIIRSRVQVRIEPHFRAAASKIEAGIAGGMAAMADDVAAAISDLIMRTVPKEKPDGA